jgi:hypothetical protein
MPEAEQHQDRTEDSAEEGDASDQRQIATAELRFA